MNEKVLIVEDEDNIRSFIVTNLTISNFHVEQAASAEEAVEICEHYMPEVAVLDIVLPGMDGYKLCKILRNRFPDIIIIMLTAKGQDADKIMGLDLGADDYMVKPFNPMELISRIKAILRRVNRSSDNSAKSMLKIKNIELNETSQKFYKDGTEIQLTQREFNLMKIFMENWDKALTRDELLDKVWGQDYFGDYKTVDVHIRRLREKVEDDPSNPQYIKTVRGYGYRFS